MRRPGRIDLVINYGNPNKESVAKIYNIYLKDLPGAENLNYTVLADRTPDCPGAVVAEIAKRAYKLCKKRGSANEEFVKAAIDSMKHHLALMKEEVEEEKTGEMTFTVKGAQINAVKELAKTSAN